MKRDALEEQLGGAVAHPAVAEADARRQHDVAVGLSGGRSSPACLNSATRVSCHSRWPRNVGEFAAAASTGPVSIMAALKSACELVGRVTRRCT